MQEHPTPLPEVSHEALTQLLDGLIRYEEREIHKLRPSLVFHRRFASGADQGLRLSDTMMFRAVRDLPALVEPIVGDQIDQFVHHRPVLRRFLDAHLPRSKVATKQAVEGALYKGALKGGLWAVSLVLAPEVALPVFVLEELLSASLEYGLVVRPTQQAQDAEHEIRSRNARIAFYRRLQRTLADGGALTAEQMRSIVERRAQRRHPCRR